MATGNGREWGEMGEELIIVIIVSHFLLIHHLSDLLTKVLGQGIVLQQVFHKGLQPGDLNHKFFNRPLIFPEGLLPLPHHTVFDDPRLLAFWLNHIVFSFLHFRRTSSRCRDRAAFEAETRWKLK